MPYSRKTLVTDCTALAGILGAAICLAAPGAAQAQPAPRVPTARDMNATAVRPTVDPLTMARHHAPGALATDAAAAATVPTTLSYPYGITVDSAGQVYVTEIFGGVNIYSGSMHKLENTITAGVSFPSAVSVAFNGNIYVANNGANNVTIYNPSLTQIGTVADSTLSNPSSMFIDADDTLWVLDAQGTLHSYLMDGTTLASTHTGGNAVGPWGPNVTVWGAANASGGYDEVYENRAQAMNSGPSLYNDYVGGSPDAAGEAEDQYGQEYVSDVLHNQVQIWSRNGAYKVGTITTPAAPYGVAVDTNLNRLYVVMTTLNEVYCYSTKAPYRLLFIIR